jgi:hypothetical protein
MRVETDKIVLRVLGHSEEEVNQILNWSYPVLASEIEKLKTLIEG